MSARDIKTQLVETEGGTLIAFESQDPRGFSFQELDTLIAAARHAQRMLLERGNRELDLAAQEEDQDAAEAAFFGQQSKLPVDS